MAIALGGKFEDVDNKAWSYRRCSQNNHIDRGAEG